MKNKIRYPYVWIPGLIVGATYIFKPIAAFVILTFFPNMNASLINYLTQPDGAVETGLAIVAIAISVWIGLNIYSYIGRSDLDTLKQSANDINKLLGRFVVQQKLDFLKELKELCVYGDGGLLVLYKVFQYEFSSKDNDQKYKTQICDMLCSIKIYTQAYHAYRSQGFVSAVLLKDFEESIISLTKHETDSLFRYYIDFLDADYNYFNHEYSVSVKRYKRMNKLIDDPNCTVLSLFNKVEFTTLINSSTGWMVFLSNQKNSAEEALKYYCPITNHEPFVSPFLSRYYRNRAVLLEKLGRTSEAKEAYLTSMENQSEYQIDRKTLHAYSSFTMKQWDIATDKAIANGWSEAGNYDKIKKDELQKVETSLTLALNSNNAGIYLQFSKMLMYKTLMMLWRAEQTREVEKRLDEAFVYLKISKMLLSTKEKEIKEREANRTMHLERDLYYVKYLICHNEESIKRAVELNEELLGFSSDNDEAKKMKGIFSIITTAYSA